MTHCEKCGAALEFRSQPTGRFDPWRGMPTEQQWSVCPNWRPRLLGGNGHDWTYLNENNIDGQDKWGRDPGRSENPPRPPRRAAA
jgi:hypothetical protein